MGPEVLKDINFSIAPRSFQYLTGPSGAGKTTLMRLVLMALQPTRGLVHLFGQDVSRLDAATLTAFRRRMGVVFQDFRLVPHLSAWDNIALPLRVAGQRDRRAQLGQHQRHRRRLAGRLAGAVHRAGHGQLATTTIRAPGPLTVGASIAADEMAPCIGLAPADIEIARHLPTFASVGLKFILIEVANLAALARAASRIEPIRALCETYADEHCDCATFLYTWIGENHVRARMFAPLDNVAEDPATGSASAALGAFLTTLVPDPESRPLLVEQGVEMGRRSLITLQVNVTDGRFFDVTVSGASVEVTRGTIRL